ncbi:hypothetical protein [Glaciecola sp. 1036]|uniref:hypothetical protein n=1 Tax=Alteromonadaceae TaxID=72275 RepID=UPI003CFC83D2
MADNKDKDFAPINVDVNDRITTSSQRRPTQTTIVKSNNWLVSSLIFVSVVAVAGCVYLFIQLQNANQTINSNIERLSSLESRLSATGEEMGESTVALQVKVGELSEKANELWEQMDKLWASAWRRNQQEIKELSNSVGNFKGDINKLVSVLDNKTKNLETQAQQLAGRISTLNATVNEQANSMLAASVERESLSENDTANASKVRDINEKLILLEQRNTNLLRQINELETKLEELIKRSV